MKRVLNAVLLMLYCSFAIAGKPGEGITLKRTVIRPYLDVSGTYDSNPALVKDNPESDIFLETEVGANMIFTGRRLNLYGTLFWYSRNYSKDTISTDWLYASDSLDNSGGGESLGLVYGSMDKLQIRARESYQQVFDYSRQPYSEAYVSEYTQDSFVSEDRGDRLERDVINANVSISRNLTDKIDLGLSGNLDRIDYKNKEMFDLDEYDVHGEFSFQVTDKSSLLLVGEYGLQKTDTFNGDPESKIIRLGWKTKFTEKSAFKGSFGMEYYDDNRKDPPAGYDSTADMPSFDLGWIWMPKEKVTISISGGNTIEPSSYEANNRREVAMLGGALSYNFTEAFMGWGGLSFRKDDYKYPDSGTDTTRKIDAYGGKLGVKYKPPLKWYSLYVTAGYETTDSTIDIEDFDQFRFTLGAKLEY